MLGVGHVVTTSVGMCDIDIRPVSTFNLNTFYLYLLFMFSILKVIHYSNQKE